MGVKLAELLGIGGGYEERVHSVHEVVAGGSMHRPILTQDFPFGENFLYNNEDF